MANPYESQLDKVFFLFGIVIMTWVAASPNSFIRGITLGRSNSADVSPKMLKTTQAIAGFAALAGVVSFVISYLAKAR